MSLVDTRNNSAMFKRAEQLRRWEESDTNRQSDFGRNLEDRKIRFSSGCVFLAACMAGDKEEVLRLLDTGADIDTANVDGLTALHQACIDDNLDMVEFLVQHSADINRADNEGWTPLHATASCGFVSIARYLIENGAELDLVNSDGELPIDLSASNSMENLLQQYIDERNIDCDEARQKEEKMMLNDAKKWLRSDASEADRRHPRTGATALHVAAAKGYAKVLSLLLAGRANVDQQDNDGWTPLHAAAHWGQKEAAQMLVTSLADMDIKNYAGQTAIDVADPDVVRFLEDMKKKKNKRRPGSQLRISDSLDINRDTPPKVIRVEAKPEPKDEEKPKPPTSEPSGPNENAQEEESNSWRRSARNSHQDKTQEKDNQITSDSDVILRRTHSFETDEKFYQKLQELRARIKSNSCPKIPATTTTTASTTTTANATTVSVESNSGGDVVGPNNNGLVTNSKLNNNSSNQINCVQRSASLKDHRAFRPNAASPPPLSSQQQQQQQSPAPDQVRRSFVPPVRDEESETQRKAHAKRVRETRRSTQGVTLDEIKSAEELVKKKNLSNSENATEANETAGSNEPTSNERLSVVDVKEDRAGGGDTETVTLRRDVEEAKSPVQEETVSFTISSPGKRNSSGQEPMKPDEGSNGESKLSATYTLPKRQSSSASASPVPFYKNYHMQQQTQLPPLNFNAKLPSNDSSNANVSATLSLKDLSNNNEQISPKSYTKKSLFDMDNANSLSLADKLRNEANKYSELSGSNKSLSSFDQKLQPPNDRTKREIITGSTQSLNESVMQNSNSNPNSNATTQQKQHQYAERRPSWRLKFDAGSKFKLEDVVDPVTSSSANNQNQQPQPSTTASSVQAATNSSVLRRPTSLNSANLTVSSSSSSPLTSPSSTVAGITTTLRPVSAPFLHHQPSPTENHVGDNGSRLKADNCYDNGNGRLEKPGEAGDDKDYDKENDSRGGTGVQATQAVIQRRRRPKRRSTGVVHVDIDDLEGDRDSPADADDKESGAEESRKSRLSSVSTNQSEGGDYLSPSDAKSRDSNGEFIDYKALYEAQKAENDKLKEQMKNKDEALSNTKAALERFTNATTKNTLSDLEKRERRAMERKMSEMEEELKLLQKYKTENERLRAENRALTRVVSKLTTSAQNQLQNK